jgi:hypothetical protein
VSLPHTKSLRLPTIENVKTENAEETEVISISSVNNTQSTTSNPQSSRSLRPQMPLFPLSITSTSPSSITTINQPTAHNQLKQFKCAKCWLRSNWGTAIHNHLQNKHGQMFAYKKYIIKLDEAEAARTLAAFECEHSRTVVELADSESVEEIVQCKPFKCSMCEYRSGIKTYTYNHIVKYHQFEYKQATRLVTVLSIDVARQTVNMYNEARARDGLFFPGKLSLNRHVDENLAINQPRGNAVNQYPRGQENYFSKPFKCGKCGFRSAQKSNAKTHMRQVHKVDSHEARILLKVLTLDEAKKTLAEYNKTLAFGRGPYCPKPKINNNNNEVNHQITQLDNPCSANVKIEPVDAPNSNEINLLSEEEISQTERELEKQPPVNNKKFKCVKCFFRSNRLEDILSHFGKAHRHMALSHLKRVQVLDEDEATRTLAAYEKNHKSSNNFLCKPYKCGICEYRAAQKSNASSHIRQIHKIGFYQAWRLVIYLPLDEAEKTVGEYIKKFGRKRPTFARERETASAASTMC